MSDSNTLGVPARPVRLAAIALTIALVIGGAVAAHSRADHQHGPSVQAGWDYDWNNSISGPLPES